MIAAAPIFITLLMTGLAGSLGHSLGMCGPLLLLAGARFPRRGLASAPYFLLYHLGRIAVYALLGLAAGALGGVIWQAAHNAVGSAIVSVLFGAAVILAGLSFLGWVRLPAAESLGGWWRSLAARVMRFPSLPGVFLMGMLNGLLPCGLVYGAVVTSAATGSASLGSLGMLIFGVGTLPVLLLFGVGAGMAALPLRKVLARVSGGLVVLVGVQLLFRGGAALGLLSHLMIGMVMVW